MNVCNHEQLAYHPREAAFSRWHTPGPGYQLTADCGAQKLETAAVSRADFWVQAEPQWSEYSCDHSVLQIPTEGPTACTVVVVHQVAEWK